jgi:methionyl-tRNA formyltransferase
MPSVLFFGSKPGSVVALTELIKADWDVRKVIISKSVNYDWYGERNLESEARKYGIEVKYQSEIIDEGNVDYVISYMFRHKIIKKVLDKAKIAAINFHAAPLPDYGGWGTYNRAILNDSTYYGCTCHYMNENFDEGDLIKVHKFQINSSDLTAIELENLTQVEMLKLFLEVVNLATQGVQFPRMKQEKIENGYMSFEQMEDLKIISKEMTSKEIEKLARAFWFPPHQGAYLKLGEKVIEVVPNSVKGKWLSEFSGNFLEHLFSELESHKKLIQ